MGTFIWFELAICCSIHETEKCDDKNSLPCMREKTVDLNSLIRFQNVYGNLTIVQACKRKRTTLSDNHYVFYSHKGK